MKTIYKKGFILFTCCLILSILSAGSIMAQTQTIDDIRGEAHIIRKDAKIYLVTYDQETEIDEDFVLRSTSYVFLTVKADVTIKSIEVAGILRIEGEIDTLRTLTVGGSSVDTAIVCGALDIRNNINIVSFSNDQGIVSESYIEIAGGKHHISSNGDNANSIAVSAKTFITLAGDNTELYTYDEAGSGYFETGVEAGTQIIVRNAQLFSHAKKAGINCEGIHIKAGATVIAEGNITEAGSYGILSREKNIIVEGGATLAGSGNSYGVRAEAGIIRASDNSTIEGTRFGVTGPYNAVHAVDKIYALDGSTIQETYKASNVTYNIDNFLSIYPIFQNNMTVADNYIWVQDQTTLRASRRRINNLEKVKLDNNASLHIIYLEDGSGGPDKEIAELCGVPEMIMSTDREIRGFVSIDKPVDSEDIEEAAVIITLPSGTKMRVEVKEILQTNGYFTARLTESLSGYGGQFVIFEFELILHNSSTYEGIGCDPVYVGIRVPV